MGRALEIRCDLSARELRALAAREKKNRTARRMLAIANALDGMSRADAAEVAGMQRQALRGEPDQKTIRWIVFPANVVRYNAAGLAGLVDRPTPGRPQALAEAELALVAEHIYRDPDPAAERQWRTRSSLVPYAGPFDGFHAMPASVSKTCLVRFDNNRYSVSASAIGRPVEIRAYAERVELWQEGRIVGMHRRAFGRGETRYDPWHYVSVLTRKPGALRNGAPFKDWVLPASLERVRRKLRAVRDGDRQMVDILGAVLSDGVPAVEAACAEALSGGVHSADVIFNILARRRDPGPPTPMVTPEALQLRCEPIADCTRYDSLRRSI